MTSLSKKPSDPIYCAYMWHAVLIDADNGTAPCCMAMGADDPTWKNASYQNGVDSPKWVESRELMEQGIWPKICTVCKKNEEIGIISSRERSYRYEIPKPGADPKLLEMDVKFTTKCNLACRMCHPSDSSFLADELRDKPKPHFLTNNWYEPAENPRPKVDFVRKAIEDGLQLLKVTGGEPAASKEFYEIIDWCIDEGYSSILGLELTTNGTKLNDRLLEKLREFRFVHFNLSIDGFEDSYDYVRWPGKWDVFTKTMMNLKEQWQPRVYDKYQDEFRSVTIATVYNMMQLNDINKFSEQIGFDWKVNCDLRPATSELAIDFISPELRDNALKLYWYELSNPSNKELYSTIKRKLTQYANGEKVEFDHIPVDQNKKEMYHRLEHSNYDPVKHKQFVETTLLLDKQRNQSYKVLHPKIVEYIDAKI